MSTLLVARVAAAIAALTIPGVTVLDLDQMPDAVMLRDKPILGPSSHDPSFLTDWENTRLTFQGNQSNSYTLNYNLYQAKVGQDRGLFAQYPAMVETAAAIATVLQNVAAVDGCKFIKLAGLPRFGPVFDASGQQFHGATFSLRVSEF